MQKTDYKKQLTHLYMQSAKKVDIVDVPKMNFLMIDGEGDPNKAQSFQDAISALYPLAYTLKFTIKKGEMGIDYSVMPLEGLWWADDMRTFTANRRDDWKWTLMIMQPDFITADMVQEAMDQVKAKKGLVSLPLVRFASLEEGQAAQTMHIGPFSEEGPTVEKIHAFIEEHGRQKRGKHHEIYISDMRRTPAERWKTVIRQPIE